MVLHFAWKEKWLDMLLYSDSWAVASHLTRWAGTWKEHNWKAGNKELCGSGMWIDLSEWACVPCQCLPKSDIAEEAFNNQVNRINHAVDISKFFPQKVIFHYLMNGSMNKVTTVSVTEVMHGPSNMDFHSQG